MTRLHTVVRVSCGGASKGSKRRPLETPRTRGSSRDAPYTLRRGACVRDAPTPARACVPWAGNGHGGCRRAISWSAPAGAYFRGPPAFLSKPLRSVVLRTRASGGIYDPTTLKTAAQFDDSGNDEILPLEVHKETTSSQWTSGPVVSRNRRRNDDLSSFAQQRPRQGSRRRKSDARFLGFWASRSAKAVHCVTAFGKRNAGHGQRNRERFPSLRDGCVWSLFTELKGHVPEPTPAVVSSTRGDPRLSRAMRTSPLPLSPKGHAASPVRMLTLQRLFNDTRPQLSTHGIALLGARNDARRPIVYIVEAVRPAASTVVTIAA